MQNPFIPFDFPHCATLTGIACACIAVFLLVRRFPHHARTIRLIVSAILLCNEISTMIYDRLLGILLIEGLPLHMSGMAVLFTAFTLITGSRQGFIIAYFWGLSSSPMALLTPDLSCALPCLHAIQFFVSHGFVLIGLATLLGSETWRTGLASPWLAFAALNVYAAAIGVFDHFTGANYFFIREKPPSPTLLDHFGPWPVYILICDGVAMAMFLLLNIPLRLAYGRNANKRDADS